MGNIYVVSALISGLFSLIVGFGSVGFKDYLDKRKNKGQKENHDSITQNDLETMVIVQKFLEDLIDRWEIDRAAIYQFHNGGKFLNGVSMKKYSLTHEATGPGIDKIKSISQNLFLSNHPFLIKKLSESSIFSYEISDPELESVYSKLEEQGVLQIIIVPIRSLNNELIGSVSFYMIKHTVAVSQAMENELITAAQKISGYLDT